MNKTLEVKQHIQILAVVIILVYFGLDGFLLGNKPNLIRSMNGQITRLENNQKSLESLQRDKKSLEDDLEESRSSFEELLIRFPNDANTENDRSAMIAGITSRLIVQKEYLKPKYVTDYTAKNMDVVSIPKVLDEDSELEIPRVIRIVNYESDLDLRANYFELLEFLHELSNQDMFFLPTAIEIKPDEDVPYGVQARVQLLTFGFDGFRPAQKR
ncbi:hypothetical protein HOF92_05260 [bacterium]|jgi:hypothetical protein|nr:hypothetical protein [bacterium]